MARVPGRFDRVDEGQRFTVLVDYAHTPGALETALDAARELAPTARIICVFGAGGDRDRAKRPLMGRVVAERADLAIVTSDNPRSEDPAAIAAEVVGDRGLEVELDRRVAIERALESAREGDVVVIAGKGHEQGQEIGDRKIPFDDVAGGTRDAATAEGAGVIALETSLLAGLGGVDARAEEFTGVQVDSRRITPGDLFVAVGAGAEFVDDAIARGAAAALVPDDAFAALAEIGRAVRDRSSARVVGITGSMGKTSTKDILAALCAPAARTIAAESSYNNEVGVPLTLCRLEPDTEVCILELAMRGFGQIAELAAIARPEIGAVTNVGPVHLELVDSLEGVDSRERRADRGPAAGWNGDRPCRLSGHA